MGQEERDEYSKEFRTHSPVSRRSVIGKGSEVDPSKDTEARVGQSPILMEYGQPLFVWLSRD